MTRPPDAPRGPSTRGASASGFDVVVIGAGIVGLATARALVREEVGSVCVVEKETTPGRHQSTHNSGVLHAGLQYRPGSEKARLARRGIRRMTVFCREHGVAHEICGKLVVATDLSELPRLEAMLDRGRRNGLEGVRRVSPEEATEIEPHVRCVGAIVVPEEGIVDFAGVCSALEGELRGAGCAILPDTEVRGFAREHGSWRVLTSTGELEAKVIVNCAGLYSDRVARMAGAPPPCRIVPFRGEYHRLRSGREHLVRHLVYPLPEPGFPFLGVHFTRRVDGHVDAGPNAVLAFAREGYDLTSLNIRDMLDALSFPGLWRFLARHPHMVTRELKQSFRRKHFLRALQRLVPEIRDDDLTVGGAGVRAQAVRPDGRFVHDFLWMDAPGAVHVVNAPSPAATASLVIGEAVAQRAISRLGD